MSKEVLDKQVGEWRKEVARLKDLIAHATGTEAAANKATEEGDRERFEAWYFPKFGPQKMLGDSDQYHTPSTQGAWQAWQAAIAADRASRHFANKAEVEPVEADRIRKLEAIVIASCEEFGAVHNAMGFGPDGPIDADRMICWVNDTRARLDAGPPATTGARTAPAEITDVLGLPEGESLSVIVQCIRDVQLAAFLAPVGASTVLTDERIKHLSIEIGMRACDYEIDPEGYCNRFARAIEQEVAAQAGQVAVPEDMARDAALWRECLDLSHGHSDEHGEFVMVQLPKPDGVFKSTADQFKAAVSASMAAPSPAKESK